MSRASTPDYSPRLSPEQECKRMSAPEDYPCFTEHGLFQPTSGCTNKCCIVPAVTPEGEDSPKWSKTLAAHMEDNMPIAVLDFDDEVETPFKKHKAPESGSTPQGEHSFNHRCHLAMSGGPDYNLQPGVAGWRKESPIKLYKDKK